MTERDEILPSWRPGATRDAVVAFLDRTASVAPEDRVACFDNDGTLWCERPTYAQLDFFVDALKTRVHDDPEIGSTPEFAALLGGDASAIGELGLERIGMALVGLFEGMTPEAFADRARQFMGRAGHATLGRPLRTTVYQPMLELLEELRRRDFAISIVTGGGTEFVRAISTRLYGVAPEAVVGTRIKYAFDSDHDRPVLRRTGAIEGDPNEGATKVTNIQTQLGRRPILAAGNSGGDREMLAWACSSDGPGLALLVDHDDPAREFAYASTAQTFTETEPITDVGHRLGWTVVSMAADWDTVFVPDGRDPS